MPTSCVRHWRTVAIDSIKGHVAMRACDHQAVQGGFMVKVEQSGGLQGPDTADHRDLPGDEITPACRQMTFEVSEIFDRQAPSPLAGVGSGRRVPWRRLLCVPQSRPCKGRGRLSPIPRRS